MIEPCEQFAKKKTPIRSASVASRAGSALLGGSLRLTPLLTYLLVGD